MTIEEFIQALDVKGINLSESQLAQYELYYKMLVDWNERVNLTAITDQEEVYLKHFYDSMMPLWVEELDLTNKTVIDIGAGAGFPSIPMLIANPTMHVTIVDSLNKRINFLSELTDALKLSDRVNLVHGRAEDVGQDKKYRGQFDIATARAVANMNVLSEYCMPMVAKGGYFVALKGAKAQEEVDAAKGAISTLGGKIEHVHTEELPGDEGERSVVLIKKTLDTPNKYPRKAGKPTKQPIK
ncbi:16S rRNA (guanine(527)-N(7))-methyltransferase RsmG [Aerococcaceae bacterium DSM 111176]|nr:16S rRNA (guanine(527)-N(7))-methyltransferase RsmG [Aerococcaceae bacterium DSM 111176]